MWRDFIFWVPVSVWKLFCMYFHQRPNLNLFYYDERKKRLRYLLLHILFFLEAFTIHLHAIFLQKINSVIIAIYSIASNEEFCITIIQLLQIWIALVSSWLIFQVNFMTFLGEKITHIYRGLEMTYICRYFCVRPLNNFVDALGWVVSYWSFYWEDNRGY